MKSNFTDFLRILLSSFFRWWWAAVAGCASIAIWFVSPKDTYIISKVAAGFYILILLTALFLSFSAIYQAWKIYTNCMELKIIRMTKDEQYGGSQVFILDGNISGLEGTLVEVHRSYNGMQVSVAILRIMERNQHGYYQASPLWFAPGHLRELRTGVCTCEELYVSQSVNLQTLRKNQVEIFDESIEE